MERPEAEIPQVLDDRAEKEEERKVSQRAQEFLQNFKKGAEFTQELLRITEKLRYQVVRLEEENRDLRRAIQPETAIQDLERRIQELVREKEELLEKYSGIEQENQDFAQRYVEIEEENNNLANLYIASYQLHSTLDYREVLQIILEIVINLIGAEEFVLLLRDEKKDTLLVVAAEGISQDEIPPIAIGEGIIGKVAETGVNYIRKDFALPETTEINNPLVCIPLKIKEYVIGVIVLYRLLRQKTQFAEVDYELFTLLAGHAATAIFSSRLYSESERRLSTFRGFIDLLTR
ncbi:MAG: GAF domain-containing protein [Proteobacteria bacterium]|nr:GAF domain-containing protein [Pseudomonadota bacterium]